jgi:hypothetical protein
MSGAQPGASRARATVIPLPMVILFSAWFVFVLVCFSDAGLDLLPTLALVYGSLLWLVVWLVRLIVSAVRKRRGAVSYEGRGRGKRYWIVEPAVLALCGILAFSGVLFHARFRLCRAALDAYVADVAAGRVQPHGFDSSKHWVGLFRVAETELLPNGVVRIITTDVFVDHAGLAYSPVTPPPVIGEDGYRHITGSWYRWYRSW